MSGPKCGEWSVQENLERERRLVAELRATIDSLHRDATKLEDAWLAEKERYGVDFPRMPDIGKISLPSNLGVEELRSIEQQLRSKIALVGKELSKAESMFFLRALLKSASALAATETSKKESTHAVEVMVNTVVEREANVMRAAGRIAETASNNERTMVKAAIEAALKQLRGPRFEASLLDLYKVVQEVNERGAQRHRDQAQAHELNRQLEGLDGVEVKQLREELAKVKRGDVKLRSAMASEVSRTAEMAKARSDRDYASQVVAEELARLGYSSSDSMETLLVRGGELVLTKPTLQEYQVHFSTDSTTNQFVVHMQREEQANGVQGSQRELLDRSMEAEWCADLASALTSAQKKGVRVRIVSYAKPGSTPVKVLNRQGSRTRRARSRMLAKQPFSDK